MLPYALKSMFYQYNQHLDPVDQLVTLTGNIYAVTTITPT